MRTRGFMSGFGERRGRTGGRGVHQLFTAGAAGVARIGTRPGTNPGGGPGVQSASPGESFPDRTRSNRGPVVGVGGRIPPPARTRRVPDVGNATCSLILDGTRATMG